MPEGRVRSLQAGDLATVAAVAYETGFFGESAARYFPDTALFGELWARAYFLEELNGPLGFAAEAGGQFLGYIIGTADMDAYRRRFVQVLGRVAWGALRGAYPQLVGCLPYLTRAARYPGPHAPEEAYPAHLHLNLRPEARGLGLGGALLDAYLEALRVRGAAGVQLSTTTENTAAVALYERRGLRVWAARKTPLWRPWLGRDATHIVMVRTLPGGS
ncbi:GNAT family N-acetyltransferase [Deinococcus hopiensis]|uniref:Acetyltransferases n=1 Tax=Deinococcus hopiensis KR-140 TaxID=695939 RepID=A0A1W1VGU6_9DEIO|nr:GNAT family N-acetyltransferase [Deinococcus hopiensis]SMB92463.1 Acetyltransferases [Deinococcus hopiensis KR-140]